MNVLLGIRIQHGGWLVDFSACPPVFESCDDAILLSKDRNSEGTGMATLILRRRYQLTPVWAGYFKNQDLMGQLDLAWGEYLEPPK